MACLRVRGPLGERLLAEGSDGNVRGMWPGESIIGVVMDCGPYTVNDAALDLDHVVTQDGFMVGNVIKKVTKALGMKQCMACQGRQIRYNQRGLELQQKIKDLF